MAPLFLGPTQWKVLKILFQILEKGTDTSDDIRGALRKLDEALKQLKKKNPREAFEDIAAAKFYLIGTDAYREPLLEAIDVALDECWKGIQGKKYSVSKIEEAIAKVKKLIDEPRGEKGRPPTVVETVRDARLWEAAKRITAENYSFDEDDERFWAVTNRIFHRMKYRLGGLPEKEVEAFLKRVKEEEEDE